jgi:hypothetical protein
VIVFSDTFQHSNNKPRKRSDILAAIKRDDVIVVEADELGKQDFVGLFLTIPHLNAAYLEVGGDRSILQGYGLQRVAIAIRAVRAVYIGMKDERFRAIVAAVKNVESANTSKRNLELTKFQNWDLDKRLKAAREADSGPAERSPTINALRLPMDQIPWLAKCIKQLINEPHRRRSSRDGQTCDPIRLNFVTDVTMFFPEFIDMLARGDLDEELRKIEDKYQFFYN